jgi:hypothetical protein
MVKVTGTTTGLLPAPGALIRIEAVYCPAVRPPGSTDTSTVAGVVPSPVTISQFSCGTIDVLKLRLCPPER